MAFVTETVASVEDLANYGHGTVAVLDDHEPSVPLSDGSIASSVLALVNIDGEWYASGWALPVEFEQIRPNSFPATVVYTI